jgi:hypothetical protein
VDIKSMNVNVAVLIETIRRATNCKRFLPRIGSASEAMMRGATPSARRLEARADGGSRKFTTCVF